METPNTTAGRLTEKIMARINAKCTPRLPTGIYNAIYSAVLTELSEAMAFPDPEGERQWIPGAPSDWSGAFIFMFKNGCSQVVWDGRDSNASQIIYHLRIPGRPSTTYNPKAFQEPDYGLCVGEYSATTKEKV